MDESGKNRRSEARPLGPHPAVQFVASTSGDWRKDHYHCLRCGARRLHQMGERMPYECYPTPQWLRDHPDEKGENDG